MLANMAAKAVRPKLERACVTARAHGGARTQRGRDTMTSEWQPFGTLVTLNQRKSASRALLVLAHLTLVLPSVDLNVDT